MTVIIILLTLLLFLTSYFCIKFALIILNLQEAIEESLDIIDTRYNRVSKILEIPIFYNSPEVKSVVQEIEDTKDALLYIANQLTKSNTLNDETNEEDLE